MSARLLSASGIAWLLLLAPAASWAAPAVDPAVELRFSPPRGVIGQQLLLEVSLTHSVSQQPRWEAPGLEGFASTRLPSEGGPMRRGAGDVAVRTTRLRLALFAFREGRLAVAPSSVVLEGRGSTPIRVEVPGTAIRIDALPEAGRPPDFDPSLVGEVALRLRAPDGPAELGSAVEFRLDVIGTAHLGRVPPFDLAARLGEGVEVFTDAPQTARTEREGRLFTRRSLSFQIVPSRPGVLRVPALELWYFDPRTARYARARSEPAEVEVTSSRVELRAPPTPDPVLDRAEGAAPSAAPGADRGSVRRILLLAALALAAGAVLYGLAQLRLRARVPVAAPAPERPVPSSGSRGVPAAPEHGDGLGALRDRVRQTLCQRHGPSAASWTPADVERHTGELETARLLRRLERARFAPTQLPEEDRRDLVRAATAYLAAPDPLPPEA